MYDANISIVGFKDVFIMGTSKQFETFDEAMTWMNEKYLQYSPVLELQGFCIRTFITPPNKSLVEIKSIGSEFVKNLQIHINQGNLKEKIHIVKSFISVTKNN